MGLGGEAKILAGGQSLVPILNMRLADPAHVIDINHLRDEEAKPVVESGEVLFGPLVRQHTVESFPEAARHLPLLVETIPFVAHPAIRSRGTVVGSVAHADPAAELPAIALALDARVHVRSSSGRRQVPAGDFFTGPLETALSHDEWVEAVVFPVMEAETGYAFEEFAQRRGDYALCGVAAVADEERVSLTFLGCSDVPRRIRLTSAGDGAKPLRQAVDEAVGQLEPEEDIHATASYRRHLAVRLGVTAAERALKRARGGT